MVMNHLLRQPLTPEREGKVEGNFDAQYFVVHSYLYFEYMFVNGYYNSIHKQVTSSAFQKLKMYHRINHF